MASISVPTAIAGAGALGAVGSVASGLIGSNAAQAAAQTQAQAAEQGQALQQQELQSIQANLAPFVSGGTGALSSLLPLIGAAPGTSPQTAALTAPFQPTQAQLAATPGYQFTLQQGLEATQNSEAAQGLAKGGPAQKAATYQQQFQNYLAQNQQVFNMLSGVTATGESGAAIQGQQGLTGTSNITNLLTGGAAATAAGQVGSANAISGALSGLGSTGSNTALLLALNNSGLFGSGAAAATGGL
jgi:hypothetical protein